MYISNYKYIIIYMYAKQAYIADNGGISSDERRARPFTAGSYK